jgi:hypothetical protein
MLYNATIDWEIQVPVKENNNTTWKTIRRWSVALDKLSAREFKHFFDFNGTAIHST